MTVPGGAATPLGPVGRERLGSTGELDDLLTTDFSTFDLEPAGGALLGVVTATGGAFTGATGLTAALAVVLVDWDLTGADFAAAGLTIAARPPAGLLAPAVGVFATGFLGAGFAADGLAAGFFAADLTAGLTAGLFAAGLTTGLAEGFFAAGLAAGLSALANALATFFSGLDLPATGFAFATTLATGLVAARAATCLPVALGAGVAGLADFAGFAAGLAAFFTDFFAATS